MEVMAYIYSVNDFSFSHECEQFVDVSACKYYEKNILYINGILFQFFTIYAIWFQNRHELFSYTFQCS